MINKLSLINRFIKELYRQFGCIYKGLKIDYIYDEKEDLYEIWYNIKEIEQVEGFDEIVGKLMKNIFIANDFYNYCVNYSYLLSKKYSISRDKIKEMNKVDELSLINRFIKELYKEFGSKYEGLHIDYVYNTKEDLYEIWYNIKEVETEEDFELKVGQLIEDIFESLNFDNYYINYNYWLSNKYRKEKVLKEFILRIKEKYDPIEFVYMYDDALKDYMIYHNREELDFEENFEKYVNDLIFEILFENGFERPVIVGNEDRFLEITEVLR